MTDPEHLSEYLRGDLQLVATWTDSKTDPHGAEPSAGAFVYVILDKAPRPRLAGHSALLYVGRGDSNRVKALRAGTHPVFARMRRAEPAITNSGQPRLEVSVYALPTPLSKLEETKFLHQFQLKHGELPPFNRRAEGWLAGRYLDALAEVLIQRVEGAAHNGARDWPLAGATAVTVRWSKRENDVATLVWIWPTEWVVEAASGPDATASGASDRGKLLVCRVADGRDLPQVLAPEKWTPGTKVTASVDAGGLTGGPAAGPGSLERLFALVDLAQRTIPEQENVLERLLLLEKQLNAGLC